MADCDGGKVRATEAYAYGKSNGSREAAIKVLAKWDDALVFGFYAPVGADRSAGDWVVTEVGCTHDHNFIFTALFVYEGE